MVCLLWVFDSFTDRPYGNVFLFITYLKPLPLNGNFFFKWCVKSILLIFYISWQLLEVFYSGLPADSCFEINHNSRDKHYRARSVCSTLVPHNDYVTKPRALNVFIDGLPETGVDKGLINDKELI